MIKKIITVATIITLITSCVTNQVTNIPNSTTVSSVEKDRIQVLGKVEANSGGGRVWVLFIPLGWGNDSWIKRRAHKKALKSYPDADGLFDQIESYHKISVPLIVITPQVKTVKVTGVAYHIRTDVELEEYRKNKKN